MAQWKYEHNVNSPSVDYLIALRDGDVDVTYLLTGHRLSPVSGIDWDVLRGAFLLVQGLAAENRDNYSAEELFELFRVTSEAVIRKRFGCADVRQSGERTHKVERTHDQ